MLSRASCVLFCFQIQQSLFYFQTAGITDQFVILTYHAVAGDYNPQRIKVGCLSDCAGSLRLADHGSDLTITSGLAVGNLLQSLPDRLLKGRPFRLDGEIEGFAPACEIFQQLCSSLICNSRGAVGEIRIGREFYRKNPFPLISNDQCAKGTIVQTVTRHRLFQKVFGSHTDHQLSYFLGGQGQIVLQPLQQYVETAGIEEYRYQMDSFCR